MPADGHEYYKTNDAKDALLDMNGKEVKGQPKEGELEIENGVTEIEEYEYYGGNLTSVFISKSVTYIGDYAFAECDGLEEVSFESGASVKLGEHVFDGCTSLVSVNLEGVSDTGTYAFAGCTSLETVTLASEVASVGDGTFYGDEKLSVVTFAGDKGYAQGGDYTSSGYFALSSSVTRIGSYAFAGTGLKGISVPAVSAVGDHAFAENIYLASVCFATGSKAMAYMFEDCTALSEVTGLTNLTSLGGGMFYGCSSLTSVNLSSLTAVPDYAFAYSGLTTFDVTGRSLGEGAFRGCTSLVSVAGDSTVTGVGYACFAGCTSLTSFDLSGAGRTVNDYAFCGCKSLKYVSLTSMYSDSSKTPRIYDYAFACSGIESVSYTGTSNWNGKSDGSYIFAYCENLTSFNVKSGSSKYMSVFLYMFAYCTNLTTIDGKDGSLLYVYDGAFMGCTSVASLSISGSVKVQCFSGNNDDWTDRPFSGWTSAQTITITSSNSNWYNGWDIGCEAVIVK